MPDENCSYNIFFPSDSKFIETTLQQASVYSILSHRKGKKSVYCFLIMKTKKQQQQLLNC